MPTCPSWTVCDGRENGKEIWLYIKTSVLGRNDDLEKQGLGRWGSCLEVKIKVATDQHKAINKNVRNVERGRVLFALLVLGTSKSTVSGQPLKMAHLDWKWVLKNGISPKTIKTRKHITKSLSIEMKYRVEKNEEQGGRAPKG